MPPLRDTVQYVPPTPLSSSVASGTTSTTRGVSGSGVEYAWGSSTVSLVSESEQTE